MSYVSEIWSEEKELFEFSPNSKASVDASGFKWVIPLGCQEFM